MYSFDQRIRYSEVNNDLKLSYYGIMNYFQDASIFNSDDLGVGVRYLSKHKQGWIVAQYSLKVFRRPELDDYVTVSTNPYSLRGMLGSRYFEMTSKDGEIYVAADTSWILMDLENMKPMRIPEEVMKYDSEPKKELGFAPMKTRVMDDLQKVDEFVVGSMFIDTNNHMNNAYYVQLVEKNLPEDYDFQSGDIIINYKKSALLNDRVDIYRVCEGDVCQFVLKVEDEIYTIIEFRKE